MYEGYHYEYERGQWANYGEIVPVPVRYTCQCDATTVFNLQQAALYDLDRAFHAIQKVQEEINQHKNHLLKIRTDVALAEKSLILGTILRVKLFKIQAKALKKVIRAKQYLIKAKNLFELMTTNYLEHK